ncbi:MAG: hypothetical protein JW841_14680 [Deltaproteobacteria bacterium]|nr:hypothetical protein [Deltaproteobacteria bacterium]
MLNTKPSIPLPIITERATISLKQYILWFLVIFISCFATGMMLAYKLKRSDTTIIIVLVVILGGTVVSIILPMLLLAARETLRFTSDGEVNYTLRPRGISLVRPREQKMTLQDIIGFEEMPFVRPGGPPIPRLRLLLKDWEFFIEGKGRMGPQGRSASFNILQKMLINWLQQNGVPPSSAVKLPARVANREKLIILSLQIMIGLCIIGLIVGLIGFIMKVKGTIAGFTSGSLGLLTFTQLLRYYRGRQAKAHCKQSLTSSGDDKRPNS